MVGTERDEERKNSRKARRTGIVIEGKGKWWWLQKRAKVMQANR
jgi:hypothetical protein